MVVLFVVIDFQNVDSKVWLLNLRTKWMTALFLKAEVKKVWRILWEKLCVCMCTAYYRTNACSRDAPCCSGWPLWTWPLGLVWTHCIPQGNVKSLKVVFWEPPISSVTLAGDPITLQYGALDPFCVIMFACASYIGYGIRGCYNDTNLIKEALYDCVSLTELGAACEVE